MQIFENLTGFRFLHPLRCLAAHPTDRVTPELRRIRTIAQAVKYSLQGVACGATDCKNLVGRCSLAKCDGRHCGGWGHRSGAGDGGHCIAEGRPFATSLADQAVQAGTENDLPEPGMGTELQRSGLVASRHGTASTGCRSCVDGGIQFVDHR